MSDQTKPVNNEMKVANYCICFIDILGQRIALQGEGWLPHFQSDEEKTNFINRLKTSVGVILGLQQQAENLIRPLLEKNAASPFRNSLEPDKQKIWDEMNKMRIATQRWSDGIVSYVPLGDSEIKCPLNGLFGLFTLAGSLCILGLASRNPVRGAIDGAWAIELRKDEIYGAAVARAYELESEIASYPRIIVSHRVVQLLEDHVHTQDVDIYSQLNREMARACLGMIVEDIDGYWIVNYLGEEFRDRVTRDAHIDLYNRARDYVLSQLNEHRGSSNSKLAFRYGHLLKYFNAHVPKPSG